MKRKPIKLTKQVYKKELGQFYTEENIFKLKPFLSWWESIPLEKRAVVLEPFAGKNGLIEMLQNAGILKDFKSFDIHPKSEDVLKRDTIKRFPSGYSVTVTNPPFLARNVATRKGLENQLSEMESFNDVYLRCLNLTLEHCEYVAIIIPESFIVSPLFKDRLFCVISLNIKKLFKDTEQPVCLALFNPTSQEDFSVYQCDHFLGNFKRLKNETMNWLLEGVPGENNEKYILKPKGIKFHVLEGQFGINCIDATNQNKKMSFIDGCLIEDKDVGYHARLRAKFWIDADVDKAEFINRCNEVLSEYRARTNDIYLTAFKGLRDDSKYRRRIDFMTVRMIVNKVYFEFIKNY